jgi:tetratricopeptide (TPR) repeat protein
MNRVASRRRGGKSLVANAAWLVVALGTAASLGPRASAADEDANGRAESRLLLWVAPADRDAGPLVFLDRPRPVKGAGAAPLGPSVIGSSGLLLRELARQAVLTAARDGCDARTRDAVLGDVAADDKPSASLVLEWDLPKGADGSVVLRREAGEVLWKSPALPASGAQDPVKLAETLQALASGPLVDALVKAGLKRVDRKPDPTVMIEPEVEQALGRMTAVSQFAAIRRLHDRVRSRGGSTVLLGALARGYAALGLLTEHHWNPAHKVYKARALLYGQQAAASDPKTPAGLWSLAFAEALVGRQRDASRHLAEADRRKGGGEKPAWVERIRLFAGEEKDKLIAGESANDPLARLLAYLIVEGGSGVFEDYSDSARSQILTAIGEVLLLETDCFRVHDAACRFSGVSLLHQATAMAPRLFEASIREGVSAVPGAPAELGDDIPKTLEAPGRGRDRGEPSLSALGQIVREARFVQAWRRLDFVKFKLAAQGFDTPPYDPALIGAHPLRPFLDAHVLGFNRREFADFARGLMTADIELTAVPLIYQVRRVDPALGGRLFNRAMDHGDEIARDLAEEIRDGPNEASMELARRLLAVRPSSPVARAVFAETDKNLDPVLAEKWEKDPTAGPGLLGALGRRYIAEKRWSDAERCLSSSIAMSPDRWAYRALANAYKAQGQTDKWKETLENFLKQEDYALDHAQVRNEIAREFMDKGRYKEALPYAEGGAQSGAAWAMWTASLCREGLEDWAEAEQWMRAVSERYDNNTSDWLWWCKRTGHGDVKAALAHAKPQLARQARAFEGDAAQVFNFGNVLVVAGEPRLALELSRRINDRNPDPNLAVRVAILADATGDAALRDRTLAQVVGNPIIRGTATRKCLDVIREWLAQADVDKTSPDLARIDAILASMPRGRGNPAYFVAQFLDNHGRKEDATSYYGILAAKAPEGTDERFRILSRIALRDRNLDPDKVAARPLPNAQGR